jgi:hypothetical protein
MPTLIIFARFFPLVRIQRIRRVMGEEISDHSLKLARQLISVANASLTPG